MIDSEFPKWSACEPCSEGDHDNCAGFCENCGFGDCAALCRCDEAGHPETLPPGDD